MQTYVRIMRAVRQLKDGHRPFISHVLIHNRNYKKMNSSVTVVINGTYFMI